MLSTTRGAAPNARALLAPVRSSRVVTARTSRRIEWWDASRLDASRASRPDRRPPHQDGGRDRTYASEGAYSLVKLEWDDAARTFTARAREGAGYDGMLTSRTFEITLVREGRGVGLAPNAAPDATFVYTGEDVTVSLP